MQPEVDNTRRLFSYELPFPPLLESWNGTNHPDQVRLREYRERLRTATALELATLDSRSRLASTRRVDPTSPIAEISTTSSFPS